MTRPMTDSDDLFAEMWPAEARGDSFDDSKHPRDKNGEFSSSDRIVEARARLGGVRELHAQREKAATEARTAHEAEHAAFARHVGAFEAQHVAASAAAPGELAGIKAQIAGHRATQRTSEKLRAKLEDEHPDLVEHIAAVASEAHDAQGLESSKRASRGVVEGRVGKAVADKLAAGGHAEVAADNLDYDRQDLQERVRAIPRVNKQMAALKDGVAKAQSFEPANTPTLDGRHRGLERAYETLSDRGYAIDGDLGVAAPDGSKHLAYIKAQRAANRTARAVKVHEREVARLSKRSP